MSVCHSIPSKRTLKQRNRIAPVAVSRPSAPATATGAVRFGCRARTGRGHRSVAVPGAAVRPRRAGPAPGLLRLRSLVPFPRPTGAERARQRDRFVCATSNSRIEDQRSHLPITSTFRRSARTMPMKPLELFRLAIAEIGYVSAAELSAYLKKKHGVFIEPAFIPLYKATLEDWERTNQLRQDTKPVPPKESIEARKQATSLSSTHQDHTFHFAKVTAKSRRTSDTTERVFECARPAAASERCPPVPAPARPRPPLPAP
jgi:hypothetical protein